MAKTKNFTNFKNFIWAFIWASLGISGLLLSGCGSVDNTTLNNTKSLSSINLGGQYKMSLTTCKSGQFDPALAKSILKENELLEHYKSTGSEVVISLSKDEITQTAPSTFFGGKSAGCQVTLTKHAAIRDDSILLLQDKSISCSNACGLNDCEENKLISNSPIELYSIEHIGNNLKLTSKSEGLVCRSENNQKQPSELNWIKK